MHRLTDWSLKGASKACPNKHYSFINNITSENVNENGAFW